MRLTSAAMLAMALFATPAVRADDSPDHELEEVMVQATRSGRNLDDEPIRVEVIVQEELEEKLLMRPGNIAMLVNETPGVRVQVTSPALGSANIRIQGLRGRYTQLLSDGLPLYGGQVPSLGLLQIPPTDLGQVEIIKGAASALYGPSALGGVINLGSKRLGEEAESEFLFNLTSRNGQDFAAYGAVPVNESWGYSIVGGANRQQSQDLDDDGWIDMPEYRRATLRPRLFWQGENGASAYFTVGAATESREGGTLPGRTTPDGQPFPQTQDTSRLDFGLLASVPINDTWEWNMRAAGMSQDDEHQYGASFEPDQHDTIFAETTVGGSTDQLSWLADRAARAVLIDPDIGNATLESDLRGEFSAGVAEDLSVSLGTTSVDGRAYRTLTVTYPITLFIPNLVTSDITLSVTRRIPSR